MPVSLDFADHLDALDIAAESLAVSAELAGPDAPVVTCGSWLVRDLVAHQGKIHRWATGNIDGTKAAPTAATSDSDLIAWYREGYAGLRAALLAAPPDLEALVFLMDAPSPKRFWGRRQSHETSIHAVDAFAAVLGRLPTAQECAIGTDFAVDGIDELVLGFIPRERTRLRSEEPYSILVSPTDSSRAWKLTIGPESVVAESVVAAPADDSDDADAMLSGTAAQLYLGLWNRGCEIQFDGRDGVLDHWRREMRI